MNLLLCGSDVSVTGATVRPVLTIAALAHRLGDHIQQEVRTGLAATRAGSAPLM